MEFPETLEQEEKTESKDHWDQLVLPEQMVLLD